MAGVGDLISECPRWGYGLLMTLHLHGLLVRLLAEVREGGALRGSSQMMSDGRCLHPRVVATTLQVSPEILDRSGDSGGAHSLIGGHYRRGHSSPGGVAAAMVRQRGVCVFCPPVSEAVF